MRSARFSIIAIALSAVAGSNLVAADAGTVSTAMLPQRSTTVTPLATPTNPRIGEKVGIADSNILWRSEAEINAELDGIAAMGGRWLRVDVPWSAIQAQGPNFWDFSAVDRVVRAAGARRIKILGVLGHAPVWMRKPGTAPHSVPLDLDAFARFARVAATRYAPMGVHHWEVWNEPNIRGFWGEAPDPKRYAEMLIKTSAELKAADPAAFVISAGLSPANYVEDQSIPPLYFLAGLYIYGAGGSFDAVGMHPYSFPFRPTTAESWNTFWQQRYSVVVMGWFGDANKKIWATEFGAPTGSSRAAVAEDVQAAQITEGIRAWREYPFDGPIFLWTWKDLSSDKFKFDDNMGILRADGTAKPVHAALSAQLRLRSP